MVSALDSEDEVLISIFQRQVCVSVSLYNRQKPVHYALRLLSITSTKDVVMVQAVIKIIQVLANSVSRIQGQAFLVTVIESSVEASKKLRECQIRLSITVIATRIENKRLTVFVEGGIP